MMTTVSCPYCGKPVEISHALEEELRHSIEKDVHNKSKEDFEKHEQKKLAEVKEKYDVEMKAREEEIAENRKQNKELRDQLTQLMQQLRAEKTARENAEVIMQKRLLEEQEKIRLKAKEEDSEKHRLDLKEKEQQLDGMRKTIEELQRKGSVGSQQLQGEVQELDLEESLAREFPDDEIQPVGKGVLGADIRQIVKSPKGMECGKILWESKRTKAWSDGWISKLKSDLIADRSHIPVIVSDTVPDEAKGGLGNKNGVWIASPKFAIILSALLRKSLLDSAKQKVIAQMKQTKAEDLYGYVTSDEFVHQMESMIDTYKEMKKQIDDERSAFDRMWKKREVQVNRLLSGASGMFGEMQGIAGSALPSIKNLELPQGEK
jgi:hypothetical protein